MRVRARYALTSCGRAAMLHDGVMGRIQRALEGGPLCCVGLAVAVSSQAETVRRRVSELLRAGLVRRADGCGE